MRAVLLFSAVLHLAAIGALAAFALRSWLNLRQTEEPSVQEHVAAAAGLGVFVAVVATLAMWMGRGFGTALPAGLVGGLLAALAFLLSLGALPHSPPGASGGPGLYARRAAAGLVGALVLTEVIAYCFLIAGAGAIAAGS